MNKKATNMALMMVFEVVIVITVIALAMSFAKQLGESETVTRVIIANDLKMMVDTLAGVPGDVIVEYPQNIENYTVSLLFKEVVVENKDNEEQETRRSFFIPSSHSIREGAVGDGSVCFTKEDRIISIRQCTEKEVPHRG